MAIDTLLASLSIRDETLRPSIRLPLWYHVTLPWLPVEGPEQLIFVTFDSLSLFKNIVLESTDCRSAQR